jgi:hypothetical protein
MLSRGSNSTATRVDSSELARVAFKKLANQYYYIVIMLARWQEDNLDFPVGLI